MLDKKAFRTLSYGLYLVASGNDGKHCGCIANTVQQVTSEPPQLSVALNKFNATTDAIKASGHYTVTVLSSAATMDFIANFGFKSSKDVDKFTDIEYTLDESAMPVVREQGVACFSVKVNQTVDVGSHLLFIGEVEAAESLDCGSAQPLTYADYHIIKGGKTPKNASSFSDAELEEMEEAVGDENRRTLAQPSGAVEAAASEPALEAREPRYGWQCAICGYVEEGYPDGLPADYLCPWCGAGPEQFTRVRLD